MSKKTKYKMMKVYNCQYMPDEIRQAYFNVYKKYGNPGNDCYKDWELFDRGEEDEDKDGQKVQ